MFTEALEDRLHVIEDEILRVTKLASECGARAQQDQDKDRQDNYWRLAQDLQREARKLREEIRRLLECSNPQGS